MSLSVSRVSKPILGYWDYRGYAQPHRLLLTYLGVDFQDKRYYLYKDGSPQPTKEMWLQEKFNLDLEFPNLPYWIDEEKNMKLTESKAILKYLAKTLGEGKLYPGTAVLQAVADMVEGVMNDLQLTLVVFAYGPTDVSLKPLEETHGEEFKRLEAFLAKRQWVVGENISYVDFYVYEVLKQFTKYNKDFLKPHETLLSYLEKFEALPQLEEYIKSSESTACFSPLATLRF